MKASSKWTLRRWETLILRWLDCVQRTPTRSQHSHNDPLMSAARFEKK